MKALALLGSPRPGHNTDLLLTACLQGITAAGAEASMLSICNLRIMPCLACDACASLGKCAIKQDDAAWVYQQVAAADLVLLASPLYFAGISAQLKALVDRAQVCWHRQNALHTPALLPAKRRLGAFIGTGGAPNRAGENFMPAIATAKLWFRALEIEWQKELVVADTDSRPMDARPKMLVAAQEFGRQLVQEVTRQ